MTFWPAWPSPNYEWFPWSICNGCGMPVGNAYPSVPIIGTCLCSNCWDQIPRNCHVFTRLFNLNTPWYFLDFASDGTVVARRSPYWKFLGSNPAIRAHSTFCNFRSLRVPRSSTQSWQIKIEHVIHLAGVKSAINININIWSTKMATLKGFIAC